MVWIWRAAVVTEGFHVLREGKGRVKRGSLGSVQGCVMETEIGSAHLGLVEEAACEKSWKSVLGPSVNSGEN